MIIPIATNKSSLALIRYGTTNPNIITILSNRYTIEYHALFVLSLILINIILIINSSGGGESRTPVAQVVNTFSTSLDALASLVDYHYLNINLKPG